MIIQFIISAVVIILAGISLTKFADKIAEETGWGRMLVGSLLLAGATSLPELMVDLKAVSMDLPDLAVGDLLGSSLFNLLILATLDFAFPSAFRRTAFSPMFLHHSLAAMITVVLTAIVGMAIISRLNYSWFGINMFSWIVVIVYLYGLRLIHLESNERIDSPTSSGQPVLSVVRGYRPLILAFIGYIASALVIVAAAPFLVHAADQFANESGLGHTFIGTTLVALATSLPELVATLAAFRMGAPDLALGNIFGSNAFNMLLIVPLDFMYAGNIFSTVKTIHAVTAFGIIAVTSIAVVGQLYRKKDRSRFTEPSSEIIAVMILLILFLLYSMS